MLVFGGVCGEVGRQGRADGADGDIGAPSNDPPGEGERFSHTSGMRACMGMTSWDWSGDSHSQSLASPPVTFRALPSAVFASLRLSGSHALTGTMSDLRDPTLTKGSGCPSPRPSPRSKIFAISGCQGRGEGEPNRANVFATPARKQHPFDAEDLLRARRPALQGLLPPAVNSVIPALS